MSRRYGIITDVSGISAGIQIENLSVETSSETVEAKNHLGVITDIAVNPSTKTLSVDGLLDTATGTTLAKPGSTILIGEEKYLITSVSQTESNSDFVRVSISATGADADVVFHVVEDL